MSAIRRKLNSQTGAAMVLALAFFLVCVMVGVVIVTAASVSAGSVVLERRTWRETEALTSAAQLLADDVTGMTFTGAYTKTETVTTTVTQTGDDYTTKVEEQESYTPGSGTQLAGSELLGLQFMNTLYYSASEKLSAETPTPVTAELTFTAGAAGDESGESESEEDGEANVPAVTGTLTVATDYTITAALTCGDSTLTMVFAPTVLDLAGEAAQTVTYGASAAVKKTTTPYTTTITWGDPVITEGGAAS